MNRQTILASIHHHLRESFAETGEVRPLGEIVPRVARDVRSESASAGTRRPPIISIEKVAAFVDGHLEPNEAEAICNAVMVDNSVLAEIIAAVRATQNSLESSPPLSSELASRLLAMRSPPSPHGDAETDVAAAVPAANNVNVTLTLAPSQRPPRRLTVPRMAAGLLVVAATIVIAVVVIGRNRSDAPSPPMIVENGGGRSNSPRTDSPRSESTPPMDGLPRSSIRDIAEQEIPESQPDPPRNQTDATNKIAAEDDTVPSGDSARDSAIATTTQRQDSIAQNPPQEMPVPPELNPLVDREPPRKVPWLADLRWTQVTGLLAQRNAGIETSGSRRIPTWRRIQEGTPTSTIAEASAANDKIALRTLPFSRADAQLSSGSRLVIAGDTELEITEGTGGESTELDLMFGAIAMVDFDDGTMIRLNAGNRTIATLRWQSKASVVVQRDATGLQIQVDGGQVEVNDTSVHEQAVHVAADRTVQTGRAPKRLPRWVTRPDESTAAERMVLAQLAETDDLTSALNQTIGTLAASPALTRDQSQALARLANWQAAMAGPNLFRLARSPVPAVRLAALQRLAQLSENDPRYVHVWNTVDRVLNNLQRGAQIRAWFRLVRNGARPNAVQMEQMINGLSSRDVAGRALSDFLLRQYVPNPPPFDPSWSGQTLQRAITIYRERAGLPVDRVRPNAAAANGV